jgi:hypothetical protein
MKIVGPIVPATHDWSRPKAGEPRMFDQPFLEWFTKVHPAVLLAIYPGFDLDVLARAAGRALGAGVDGALRGRAAGVDVPRYVIHRFSFHFAPNGNVGVMFAYLIHGVHPRVSRGSSPLGYAADRERADRARAVFRGFRLVLGPYVNPIGSGVAIGYLVYDLTHYFIHRGPLKSRAGRFLRTHHMQHHYATPERRFGVSTPFWDYVFRTHR